MTLANPQRKFDSMAAFYASLGRCPRLDRDDAAVVKEYIGSMHSNSRCLAEEFSAGEACDLFGIEQAGVFEHDPRQSLCDWPVMFDTRPNTPRSQLPPPPPEEMPKKRGRPKGKKSVKRKTEGWPWTHAD